MLSNVPLSEERFRGKKKKCRKWPPGEDVKTEKAKRLICLFLHFCMEDPVACKGVKSKNCKLRS
jgi:hypothetical protein